MFTDSVYQNMDEISQLVEPFQCKFNAELAKLPEEIQITYEILEKHARFHSGSYGISSFPVDSIIVLTCREVGANYEILKDRRYIDYNEDLYKIWIEQDATIDFEKKTLAGDIKLIKAKEALTDEELYSKVINNLDGTLYSTMYKASNVSKANVNEIAEIFDIEGVNKVKSIRDKKNTLIKGLLSQFEDRKINIRDLELGFRFADWIKAYLCRGNLAAIKNLTLFKVMMLNGLPIYSLDNEEPL